MHLQFVDNFLVHELLLVRILMSNVCEAILKAKQTLLRKAMETFPWIQPIEIKYLFKQKADTCCVFLSMSGCDEWQSTKKFVNSA